MLIYLKSRFNLAGFFFQLSSRASENKNNNCSSKKLFFPLYKLKCLSLEVIKS